MRLPALAALLLALPALADPADDPFRVASEPPTAAYTTAAETPVPPDLADVPMLRDLAGWLGDLDTRDIVTLRRAVKRPLRPEALADATRLGVLHMSRDGAAERLELLALPDHTAAVRALDRPDTPAWSIDPDALDPTTLHLWRSAWSPRPSQPAERFELAGDADPSPVQLDRAGMRRIFHANYPERTRDLAQETVHIRVPKPFDPSRPAGILLWVSPAPDARFPPLFEPALDALNLIAVSAENAGNERHLGDRLQLCLDAVESARRRYLIDDTRVYVTGLSGGGRCTTMLQCCLPDLFTGAVPIVGMDTYHNAPTGNGATHWPARFGKPPLPTFRLLKQRRVRGITGAQDFNEHEMAVRTKLLKSDGLDILLDDYPDMGHALPTADRFQTALAWVDEPQAAARDAAVKQAADLLAKVPPGAPTDPAVRSALIDVVRAAPWSDPAWTAAERLGYPKAAFLSPSPAL